MGVLKPERKSRVRSQRQEKDDPFILEIGKITEAAILGSFRESRSSMNHVQNYLAEQRAADEAYWAVYRRKDSDRLEEQYPGYRAELDRRRAGAGLQPL